MKTKISFSLLLAAAASGLAFGQTAFTTPVGYVSLAIGNAAGPAVPANSDVSVSLPLDRSTEFVGLISSVAGNVITVSGTGLGAFSDPTNPHVAKIASGAKNGLTGAISSNTSNTLTIMLPAGDTLTGVVAGDSISVHKAWTPKSIFSVNPPAQTQILAYSGSSSGINIGVDLIYEFDGTAWIDTGSFESADNAIIYQGEGFTVRNSSASAISSIVVSGNVTRSNNRTVISKLAPIGQDNVLGYTGSVGEIIGSSGLSSLAVSGDQILAVDNAGTGQNKGASTIIEYDGAAWIDTGSFEDVTNTFRLEAGVGYIYRRSASAPSGDVIWSDQPSYVPSL